jgi:EmrB/QacA subfamily drug resistance transporter
MSDTPTPRLDRNSILLVTSLSSFLNPFMGSSINVALPLIGKEYALNAVMLGWVSTSFLLSTAVFLVPFGRLADICGRRKSFVWGLMVYALSSLFCALAPSASILIALRGLQGLGSAMIFGTAVAIVTSVFPPGERGRALGLNVGAVYLGLSIGPVAGGFMVQHLGWRSIFYANGFGGIVLFGLAWWSLKSEWAEARGERFDLAGSLAYALMLTLVILGFTGLPGMRGLGMLVGGAVLLAFFLAWEARLEHPVLPIRLFLDNPLFAFSNLAAFIHYSATAGSGFLLSLYLQYCKGFSPQHAGLILGAQPLVMALGSPLAGKISDRVEPRLVASSGMAMTVVSLFLFSLVHETTPLAFIMACLLLSGFGFALFSSPNTNAIMGSVERKHYGLATGTLATMRVTGQMASMSLLMLLFALMLGSARITPELYPKFMVVMKTAFVIFTILCVFGLLASLARGKMHE